MHQRLRQQRIVAEAVAEALLQGSVRRGRAAPPEQAHRGTAEGLDMLISLLNFAVQSRFRNAA